mmetsp:Transcript_25677/g.59853  ORF Transcript_25677/g.59853 Transcript_25677/m.59853 type:complete len:769 (-) Transcript_25677:67-2373(-)
MDAVYGCSQAENWQRLTQIAPCGEKGSADAEVVVAHETANWVPRGWDAQPQAPEKVEKVQLDTGPSQSTAPSTSLALEAQEGEESPPQAKEEDEVQQEDSPKEKLSVEVEVEVLDSPQLPPERSSTDLRPKSLGEVSEGVGSGSPQDGQASRCSSSKRPLSMRSLPSQFSSTSKASKNPSKTPTSVGGPKGLELLAGVDFTEVEDTWFTLPLRPLKMSGGTASFYALELSDTYGPGPSPGFASVVKSKSHWIGKDLAHAHDEVVFYETALRERTGRLGALLQFMFEYAGVANCQCAFEDGTVRERPLLVLRNLMDGCKKLRLLDLKIGKETAVSGWKGKSRFGALRQKVIDTLTNSAGQGFRLEGFDCPPDALSSMDPLQDLGGSVLYSSQVVKKCRRLQYQRLKATEIMMHFIDVRDTSPETTELENDATRLHSVEWTEIVLSCILRQLLELQLACYLLDTPQKWIGSSVAVAFDVSRMPSREEVMRNGVRGFIRMNIFDWGRSELNGPSHHVARDKKEQADREKFWGYYKHGVSMLCWEVARTYFHQFCNFRGWSHVRIDLYDFSSHSENRYIGSANVQLETLVKQRVELSFQPPRAHGPPGKSSRRKTLCGFQGRHRVSPGAIVCSCEWRVFPSGSRLLGAYFFTLHRAEGLKPNNTTQAKPCAMAVLTGYLVGKARRVFHGHHRWTQQSKVVPYELNPYWDAVFEIPTLNLANGHALDIFKLTGVDSLQTLIQYLPSPGTRFEKQAFQSWCALFSSSSNDITEL